MGVVLGMTQETFGPHSWDGITPHVSSHDEYVKIYEESISSVDYWARVATDQLSWYRPFDETFAGSFQEGNFRWFEGGKLNASYNCLDRWVKTKPKELAFIWEADVPGNHLEITFEQAFAQVCRFANLLIMNGVKKGDRVAIYMPMVPEAAYAMLACARIGAIHSVVFAGFSAEALRARILDADCQVVLTANVGVRGGRTIPLKATVDAALIGCPNVRRVFVHKHRHHPTSVTMKADRDFWLEEGLEAQRPYCPAVPVDSEDPLFMLYTSGSTGKPKGLIHTTGGYLTYAAHTTKMIWDIHPGDRFACVADVGWITGHTYVLYGPLLNGCTTAIFESIPTFPDASRYWQMIETHKFTQFYTAPTAIRTLMSYGTEFVSKNDCSSLRVLGSVGEPINPEAWRWYYNEVGKQKCSVVDSYWQTETGGIVITPLPGATTTKPGSATFPFFGQVPKILDPITGDEIQGSGEGVLVLSQPWPSMARTIYGDHSRYMSTYLNAYPGFYFTGDGASRDEDGYIWITGRVDDVITKCGHRLGTAEIESSLVLHPSCAEAAVVAIPDEIRGQAIVAFVILNRGETASAELEAQLRQQPRQQIGGIAVPDYLIILPGLPKTRSGKIMRRILRKVAEGTADQLGDVSTLAEPEVVPILIQQVNAIIYKK